MVEQGLKEEEKKLINKLKKAGLQKNIAKTLVFVASRGETKRKEIENATNLRQPQVSIAIQKLEEFRWVTKRNIKKKGKGRPIHGYNLDKPIDEIIREIEKREKKRIKEMEENLEDIKKLANSCF